MKRINFKFLGSIALFFILASTQLFAVDILLRKDDPNPGTVTLEPMRARRTVTVPVLAEISNGEIGVYFGSSVGTAYLTVLDASGAVVMYEALNTNDETEFHFSLDGLANGKYTLKISYGSTRLTGDFVY